MVFCTIIVVIMSNPFRWITLNLPCTVTCSAVQQIFFFCVPKGKCPAIKTVHSKEVSCENGILHNHWSDNVEPISKDNSEFALHCYLLSGSTDFFFCVSKGKCPAIKTVHSKEVSCENGILHNHCSDNVDPISKDNSEFALHCYLLSGSTDFFFWLPRKHVQLSKPSIQNKLVLKMVFWTIIAVIMSNLIRKIALNLLCSVPSFEVQQIFFLFLDLQGNTSSSQNFQFERSWFWKWYLQNH